MKKDNINHIIKVLVQHNDWISASELAAQMHVSSRSVRNYIKQINNSYKMPPILSSYYGYKWAPLSSEKYASGKNEYFPKTPNDRYYTLLKSLVYHNTYSNLEPLTASEFCDTLCISLSSLANDTDVIRKMLSDYMISLHIKNEDYSISGDEINIRHLMYDTISHFFVDNPFSIQDIVNSFSSYHPDKIKNYIESILNKYNYICDAYHINSLVLYLIIQIVRIENGHIVNNEQFMFTNFYIYKDYDIANEIIEFLSSLMNLKIDSKEITYATVLILSTCNNNDLFSLKYSATKTEVENCLQNIETRVNILFKDETLILAITDFFERMEYRCKYSISINNPLKHSIRSTLPVVHDEAVWMINHFRLLWDIKPSDNETAYLTMLLSNYLRAKQNSHADISCTLICPEYFGMTKQIKNHLEEHFGNQIYIISIIDSVNVQKLPKSDMYISLLDIKDIPHCVWISISLGEEDHISIRREIYRIKNNRQYKLFSMYLQSYSGEHLFERNHHFNSRYEAIHYICDKLLQLGYIDHSFENQVLQREHTETTAYFNFVAIPHTANKGVTKNSIFIILNDHPITWGRRKINLIILIAMEKTLITDFKYFYETIINIFNNRKNMISILQTTDYNSFLDTIIRLYTIPNSK